MKGFSKSLYKRKRINNLLIINPFLRAEDGAQTRDPQLGRLMLYQLSYFRNSKDFSLNQSVGKDGFEPPKA